MACLEFAQKKELKKLTNTLNPDINPDDLVSAEVVRFKSFDDLEIPAIYYKPLTASTENKVPALVWVHGGPGGQSDGRLPTLQGSHEGHDEAPLGPHHRHQFHCRRDRESGPGQLCGF